MSGTTLIVASSEQSFGGHKWRDMAEEELSRLGIAVVGTQSSAGQCTVCMKRKSPTGRHHPLGNIAGIELL